MSKRQCGLGYTVHTHTHTDTSDVLPLSHQDKEGKPCFISSRGFRSGLRVWTHTYGFRATYPGRYQLDVPGAVSPLPCLPPVASPLLSDPDLAPLPCQVPETHLRPLQACGSFCLDWAGREWGLLSLTSQRKCHLLGLPSLFFLFYFSTSRNI